MAKSFKRPRNEKELNELEATGLWLAQILAKEIGENNEKITLRVILRIHKIFLIKVRPEIAGRFRIAGEDIKKLKCIEPPPGRLVNEKIYEFWKELDYKLAILPKRPRGRNKKTLAKWNSRVLDVATWTQYKITAIHPFCEGNGRMARMMTNLILRRYGLQPSDVRYEGDHKAKYLKALCQIDYYGDYEPLKKLIADGMYATYQRVYEVVKKQARFKVR